MEVALEVVVRCTEIDVNGHVNNAKYVEYLAWGREEWYDQHGFPYERLLGLGAVTVVVNINLNIRQACHQGDLLRIVTRTSTAPPVVGTPPRSSVPSCGPIACTRIWRPTVLLPEMTLAAPGAPPMMLPRASLMKIPCWLPSRDRPLTSRAERAILPALALGTAR